MINKNNYHRKDWKDFLDHDVIHENIHGLCDMISLEVLQFIFQKSGIVSWLELIQNYLQILKFSWLEDSTKYLYHLIVEGRSWFAPKIFENDEEVNAVVRSIARLIFMEEAQMMLQSQHNQQAAAPSLEQSHYTITKDETRGSDNELSDL